MTPLTAALRLAWALAALALAAAAAAAPRDVEVGAFVTSISDIDQNAGTYSITLYAWFIDPNGSFDPVKDMYVIARSAQIDEVDQTPLPTGGSYTTARIAAVVDQDFALTDFPFDSQRLTLELESAWDSDVLRLVPDDEPPQVADYLDPADWHIRGIAIEAGEHAYTVRYGLEADMKNSFSQVSLIVDVDRERSPVLIDDFLGFIFAFLITGLAYFVPCTELGLRVGMTSGSLFAAVVNLNRLLDSAGYKPEFGLVERLGFLLFGTMLVSLAISVFSKRMAERGDKHRANHVDTILGAITMAASASLIAWTLHGAMT